MRFVDTSFWIAFHLRRDAHHEESKALWRTRGGSLVTSNLVVGEAWTFMRRRDGHRMATRLLDGLTTSPSLLIHRIDEAT